MENKQYIDIEIVKTIMETKNIDEKELSKLICVTLPTIKRFIGGADQRHMSGAIFYKLAKALDVSVQSLLHKDYK